MNVMTKAQIEFTIREIGTVQDWTNHKVHVVLCHMTMHTLTDGNGDVSLFERLIGAVKGADRKAIIRWIIDNCPVQFDKDGHAKSNKTKFALMRPGGAEEASLEGMLALTPWFDRVPTPKQIMADFDLVAQVEKLLSKAETIEEEGKRHVVNAGVAEYVRTALMRFRAEKAEATAETTA